MSHLNQLQMSREIKNLKLLVSMLTKEMDEIKNSNINIYSELNAIKNDSLIWSNVSELKGWGSEVVDLYKISSIPHTVLIDKEGNIIVEKLFLNHK